MGGIGVEILDPMGQGIADVGKTDPLNGEGTGSVRGPCPASSTVMAAILI